jgi:RimJ/RimL family protein N-acetyltransferase
MNVISKNDLFFITTSSKGWYFLILRKNGESVGFANLDGLYEGSFRPECVLAYQINEDYRGHGLGSWLVETIVNHNNGKEIYASVKSENLASQKILEKLGFKKIEFVKNIINYKK